MIKNIMIDLDDTIFDFHTAEKIAVKRTMESFGIEPKEEYIKRYSEINRDQWNLLEQGKITRTRLKIRRYELLFEEIGVDFSGEEATKRYEKFLGMGHIFIDGADNLLKNLSEKYRLYIATNGTLDVQKSRIKSSGIEKYTKGIFISQEIGYDKPSRNFFNCCFEKMENFEKCETVIVGDSLSSDIQGGKNSGIRTIWYNPKKMPNKSETVPDYEINGLEELYEILPKIL